MGQINLFGTAVKGRSANVTAQKRINMFAEAPQGLEQDKSGFVLYPRPGLKNAVQRRSGSAGGSFIYGPSGPARTIYGFNFLYDAAGVYFGKQFVGVVAGSGWSLFDSGGFSLIDNYKTAPQFRSNSGPVSIADNGVFLVMVDGVSVYYLPYQSGSVFSWDDHYDASTFLNNPIGATSVCFIAQRFVFNVPAFPGRFAWSDVNGVTYSALSYATAESNPDALVAVWESRGELVLWGTETTEIWAPTGDSSVFARVGGSALQWGLASQYTLAKTNTGTIFVGRNLLGSPQVAILEGYQVRVVSTPDIERILLEDGNAVGSSGYTMTVGGTSFYVLQLNSKTMVYNLTTGEWDEWQTFDPTTGQPGKFCGQYGTAQYGKYMVSDYRSSQFYYVDPTVYTDDTAPIQRQVDTRHIAQDLERITVNRVTLDVEQGVGLNSGQGSDPQIALQVSRDGGHTFGNELWTSLGAQGKYRERVEWWRLGRARDFVFRFKIFDAVKAIFIGASMDASK